MKLTKKYIWLFPIAVLGVLLLLWGSLSDADKDDTGLMGDEISAYQSELEAKVESLCSSVAGVGNVECLITLSGGYKSIYAVNSSGEGEGVRREYLTVGSGSGEHAVLVVTEPPEIAGVGIVCRGGSSEALRAELISLVSSALGIGSNKIHISGGK